MSKCHCQDYYDHMNELDTKAVQDFDPEDPKVWEQADAELQAAASKRDAIGPHPVVRAICYAVVICLVGFALSVGIVMLRRGL